MIEALGEGLEPEYHVGQRVIVGAITPCGQCFYCLNGAHSQCGGPLGGWRFGNTIDGAWAEYLLVPDARANLAPIPDALTDEQVRAASPTSSRPASAAPRAATSRSGDAVAVFAQGPIGLCATLGAKLRGAGLIIGVDSVPERLDMARRFGANVVINHREQDPVAEIKRLTGGRGVDVAIEALGRQETFENALRATRPGGTLSSLGVYSGKLVAPYEALLRRPRRSTHRDDAVPGRQGADAAADGDGGARPRRSEPARHPSLRPRRHRRGLRRVQRADGGRVEGRADPRCETEGGPYTRRRMMRTGTILVVDDEHLIRWSLAERLRADGYDIVEAGTGREAVARAKDGVDLVLLDYKLPDMDGVTVLRQIKEHDRDVLVILLTAYATIETAVEAMKIGACHFANKPFDLDDVSRTVAQALETTRRRSRRRASGVRSGCCAPVRRSRTPSGRELASTDTGRASGPRLAHYVEKTTWRAP